MTLSSRSPQELAGLLTRAHRAGIAATDLDETVHDIASQEASQANNGGLEAQLSYLLATIGPAQTAALLSDLTPGPPDQAMAPGGRPA